MNLLRNVLIGAIVVVIFFLFVRWNEFSTQQAQLNAPSQETLSSELELPIPEPEVPDGIPVAEPESIDETSDLPPAPVAEALPSLASSKTRSELIEIQTDTLDVIIDTKGGDIVKVALPQYPQQLKTPDKPFILLNRAQNHTYLAQSGLVGPNGTDKSGSRPTFSTSQSRYTLAEADDKLVVDLYYEEGGTNITKRFTFSRDSYLIDLEYLIDNQSENVWSAALYGQIKRDSHKPSNEMIGMQPYVGAAITTLDENYKKISFGDLKDKTVEIDRVGGWVSLIQHYFVSAWIPDPESKAKYTLRKLKNQDIYLLSYTGTLVNVEPASSQSIKAQFYAGPKVISELEKISPHLDLTIDFSWLWFIAKPLFLGLDWIHGIVGNWGIAIILLTLAIKILFFYPSAISYRSMAKMRKLQPKMMELKEKYGDDRQKMGPELMKLYKKEGVNPFGGCLPILMQMPVFIALYWVLMESVELRHAPFFLWITDLSVKDPWFILPLLMGLTMYIQQKLNPTPPDPMQAKVMQMMPFFFTILFAFFPAGLVLYWVVNNTLSIIQQYIITKQIENA